MHFSEIRNEIDRQYKVNSFMSAYCFVQGILWTARKFKIINERDYYKLDQYSHERHKEILFGQCERVKNV